MIDATTYRAGRGAAQEPVVVAAPGPGQIRVSIRATGVCHSDLHIAAGRKYALQRQRRAGIVALGLGTFAPHVVVPETAAVKVDDDLPFTVGALLGCSVTTGVGAVLNTARVPTGASAVVIGCGNVGLSVVMGLKLAGAHPIIAVDLSPEKRANAQELGATIIMDPRETDLTEYVHGLLGGVDFAFEAIGNEKEELAAGIGLRSVLTP